MPYRPNYVASSLSIEAEPVQVEACMGLNGVETPGGLAVLVWNVPVSGFPGRTIHCAVVDSPDLWATSGVITPDLIRDVVVVTTSSRIGRPSVMVLGDELVVVVDVMIVGVDTTTHTLTVLVADDANNPTSWAERGVIKATQNGGRPDDGGSIFQMDSGRWVFSGVWRDGTNRRSGTWHSDDRGASWTAGISDTLVPNVSFGMSGQFTSAQIDLHPGSQQLMFMNCYTVEAGFVPSTGGADWGPIARWYFSSDGANWDFIINTPDDVPYSPGIIPGPLRIFQAFTHTDGYGYLLADTGVIQTAGGSRVGHDGDPEDMEWYGHNFAYWPETYPTLTVEERIARRGMVTQAGDAYIFYKDKWVTSLFTSPSAPTTTGWIVGSIGFGQPPDVCA